MNESAGRSFWTKYKDEKVMKYTWMLLATMMAAGLAQALEPPLTQAEVVLPEGGDADAVSAALAKLPGVGTVTKQGDGGLTVTYNREHVAAKNLERAAPGVSVKPLHASIGMVAKSATVPSVAALAEHKLRQAEEMAQAIGLSLPAEFRDYLEALQKDGWEATTNLFEQSIRLRIGYDEDSEDDPALSSMLWQCVLEANGGSEQLASWNGELHELFARRIFDGMPANSIYFGGTDQGRFSATLFRELQGAPEISVLTQNALADNTYLTFARLCSGDSIYVPSQEDSNAAFQKYVEDVRAQQSRTKDAVACKDGRVTVEGIAGVMAINGLIARVVFDQNKDTHDFFVEESYVIPWMYPYLSPHGAILKLNREPLAEISAADVARDTTYWADLEKTLMDHPAFSSDLYAQKSFAKLRSAIAGVYAHRKMYAEADAAFRQALRLYPALSEAAYRLSDLLMQQFNFTEAQAVLDAYGTSGVTTDQSFDNFRSRVTHLAGLNERRLALEKEMPKGASTKTAIELLDIYQEMNMAGHHESLAQRLLEEKELSAENRKHVEASVEAMKPAAGE